MLRPLVPAEITVEEALRRHQLSEGQFRAWQREYEAFGLPDCAPPACSNTPDPAGTLSRASSSNKTASRIQRYTSLIFMHFRKLRFTARVEAGQKRFWSGRSNPNGCSVATQTPSTADDCAAGSDYP